MQYVLKKLVKQFIFCYAIFVRAQFCRVIVYLACASARLLARRRRHGAFGTNASLCKVSRCEQIFTAAAILHLLVLSST